MSRGSPGRNVPVNCEASPISRVRASSCRPSSSWRRSHEASAAGTSPAGGRQFLGEGPAVGGGLGGPRRRVRPDGERRVADEADPALRHPGNVDVVDRLDERLGCAGHDLGDRRGEHLRRRPPHARHGLVGSGAGGQRHRPPDPVPPGHEPVQLLTGGHVDVPDHVDQPVALGERSVEGGDRVDEDVAVGQDLVVDRILEGLAGGGDRPAPAACRARRRNPHTTALAPGISRPGRSS